MLDLPEHLLTFVDILRWRADRHPSRLAFTYLEGDSGHEVQASYEQLDVQSRSIAAKLQLMHAEGERAVLLFPSGLDFISGFFGCLYAGVIAVTWPPLRPGVSTGSFEALLRNTDAKFVLGTTKSLERTRRLLNRAAAQLEWFATDDHTQLAGPQRWRAPNIGEETIAFLQHTSGSSSQPRGVVVSHRNLLFNERMISTAFEHDEVSTVVGWLPMFHDMGLIGNVLQPIYIGSSGILLSPSAFVQRPIRWLQAISRYRARTSGGPNFAYDLCVENFDPNQCQGLDLSCWTLAFNGAEPIHAHTIDRFCATFEKYGFNRKAFYPCYGLAEATLFVTGGTKSEPPVVLEVEKSPLSLGQVKLRQGGGASSTSLIGCGRAFLHETVLIVDTNTSGQCADGYVGEVWVSGSNVGSGYWNNPIETERTFGARVDNVEGAYLRTGDLGFKHDGQLFIVGRQKDLIIVRGRNYWPQDLERTATRCHPLLRASRGAAFSTDEGTREQVTLVLELVRGRRSTTDLAEVFEAVRRSVAIEHELTVSTVVLVEAATLPVTSSGKIRRRQCRLMLLNDELTIVGKEPCAHNDGRPSARRLTREDIIGTDRDRRMSLVESYLMAAVAGLLRRPSAAVPGEATLAALGLDSVAILELANGIETDLGIALPFTHLLEASGLADIAQLIAVRVEGSPSHTRDTAARVLRADNGSPISDGQRALWFLQSLFPHRTAHNITVAAEIQGDLDVDLLRRAFQQLVDRHESLRSQFHSAQGDPVRTIRATQNVCFIHQSCSNGDGDLTEVEMVEGTRHAFDLENDPLLRVMLFRRSAVRHVLIVTAHHLIVDFWSLGRLLRELNAIYASETTGKAAQLPAPKPTFSDYVVEQSGRLGVQSSARLKEFWRVRLKDQQFDLRLPLDRFRTSASPRAEARFFEFSPHVSHQLKRLAQSHDVSLYGLLLTAWQITLFRLARQERFTVGTLTSGRHIGQFSDVVGYLVNPVVIAADLGGDPSVSALITATRRTVASALAHSEYPFPLLVEQINPPRNFGRTPLFRTMFNWQQSPVRGLPGLTNMALGCRGGEFALGPLTLKSIFVPREGIDSDLELALGMVDGQVKGFLAYDANLFDASTVDRIVDLFSEIAGDLIKRPERRISELPGLRCRTGTESAQHPTHEVPQPEATIDALFRRRIARTPDKIALVSDGAYVSYAALGRQVARVANLLLELDDDRTRGSPFPLVAILTRQSQHFVFGAFAALQSGRGVVPLQAQDPVDRQHFMLTDCGVDTLITERALLEKAHALGRRSENVRHIIVLDALADVAVTSDQMSIYTYEEIALRSTSPPHIETPPEQVAYALYTSGTTTGNPKGVLITHRNLIPLLEWHCGRVSTDGNARTVQTLSFTFDVGLWEVFSTVLSGGTLFLEEDALRYDPRRYVEYVNRHRINTINATPTFIREVLDGERFKSVEMIQLIGETLAKELLERVFERVPEHCRVLNAYGPTEATVYTTMLSTDRRSSDDFEVSKSVPIGTCTAGSIVHLLHHGNPVRDGVTGEIHIGGPGTALGYLNQPDLTATAFIPDPFVTLPGARLYRTGDRAVRLHDGNIEFLGRMDQQVKIRGFRVEPQEIEAVLNRHPAVSETAVVPTVALGEVQQLSAYIVMRPGHRVVAGELLWFAREKLPDYMVPAALTMVERLPRTSSGKLDRRAIEPDRGIRLDTHTLYDPPQTELEKLIAEVWREELGIDRIGLDDNFFDLGGHSLKASRVHARLEERRGSRFPLGALFEYTNIRSLAGYLVREPTIEASRGGSSDAR
jgi:amino acid adenylation domain-containing protein